MVSFASGDAAERRMRKRLVAAAGDRSAVARRRVATRPAAASAVARRLLPGLVAARQRRLAGRALRGPPLRLAVDTGGSRYASASRARYRSSTACAFGPIGIDALRPWCCGLVPLRAGRRHTSPLRSTSHGRRMQTSAGPHAREPLQPHHVGHDGRQVRQRGVDHGVVDRLHRLRLAGLGLAPPQPGDHRQGLRDRGRNCALGRRPAEHARRSAA